jgi:hypothetical protein
VTFPEETSISIHASASELKAVKLAKGAEDTGSLIYLAETLQGEVDRARLSKEKLEQSARLSASLRRDIEAQALRTEETSTARKTSKQPR